MPRQPRVQFSGAIYHVMSRGDRREDIFLDDVDRQDFLKTLAEASLKTGWQVHAYCLMSNHFHLVFETPPPACASGWLKTAKHNENKPMSRSDPLYFIARSAGRFKNA